MNSKDEEAYQENPNWKRTGNNDISEENVFYKV